MAFVRLSFQASISSARAFRFSSLWLCLAALAMLSHRVVRAESIGDRERVQRIVDDSRARLPIPEDVQVSIVPENPLMVSVQRQPGHDDVFQLSFEEEF